MESFLNAILLFIRGALLAFLLFGLGYLISEIFREYRRQTRLKRQNRPPSDDGYSS